MAGANTALHLLTTPPIIEPNAMAPGRLPEGHIPLPPPVSILHYLIACVILLVFTVLAVAVKLALTWSTRGRFTKDDLMIGSGLLSLIATAYTHGLGKSSTVVDGPTGPYPSWRAFYWEHVFYTVWYTPLCFSKLAFFLMYCRTLRGRGMKRTLWVSMIIFTALTVLFITGTALMSEHIKQSRVDAIKTLRYHVQFRYLHYAWGTCDILADLWICILPIWGLKALRIPLKRRLALAARFALPVITFILSIARIYELNLVMSRVIVRDHTWDPSLAEAAPVLWAFVQAAAAVTTTALPALAVGVKILRQTKRRCDSANVAEELASPPTSHEAMASERSDEETGVASLDTATITHASSRPSTADKEVRRPKRSKSPDEYCEEVHPLEPLSEIAVTRTVDVTTTVEPEEGFRFMFRQYAGLA